MLDPFIEGYLISTVPIYTERNTIYYAWGDWFAWVMVAVAVSGLVGATAVAILRRKRSQGFDSERSD